jgi:hypothetical protein
MCTVLLPQGDKAIAVNKYIISSNVFMNKNTISACAVGSTSCHPTIHGTYGVQTRHLFPTIYFTRRFTAYCTTCTNQRGKISGIKYRVYSRQLINLSATGPENSTGEKAVGTLS